MWCGLCTQWVAQARTKQDAREHARAEGWRLTRDDGWLCRECINWRTEAMKLTDDQIRDIRKRATDGDSNASLARAFDVHPTTIQKIVAGKLRKDVAPFRDAGSAG